MLAASRFSNSRLVKILNITFFTAFKFLIFINRNKLNFNTQV